MKTDNKLFNRIMEYWEDCINCNNKKDLAINNLLEKYALTCGIDESKLEYRIDLTVKRMSLRQKRKLYKIMLKSGIREWRD